MASPRFRSSERLCQLLRFTVETALDGRAHQLKESVIAVEVFGREASFDPKLDAIVRVNMAKLRARLAEHYLGAGARDAVRIEYPRGAYVPLFVEQIDPDPEPLPATEQSIRRFAWAWTIPVAVALAVAGWWLVANTPLWRSIASTPGSVAVLPFLDLSDTKDQETFCDSLTEEIIDEIGKHDRFRVVGRTSSFEFKGRTGDLRDIGQKLGAERILEGSVRRSGGRIRVTAHLNETATGYRVWSERWERDDADPLILQDEIGRAIAARIAAAKQEAAPSRQRLEARALYLKGRHFYDQGNMDKARELYEQAAAIDPNYAQAHAGRARALIALAAGGRRELRNPGHAAADTALRLDPSTLEAYAARVQAAHFVDFDWAAGVKACEEGASYGSNDAPFRRHCALLLSLLGDSERALAEIREAVLIEPTVASYSWTYSFILYRAGLFDEAVHQLSATMELKPDELRGYLLKALALANSEKCAEALALLREAAPLAGQDPVEFETVSAVVNAFAGNADEAKRIMARSRLPAYLQARVYSALGDVDRALTLLEQSAARGEQETAYVLADPGLLRHRGLPRYQELRHRFRLPPMGDHAAVMATTASSIAR
ncbi:MAG: tetratricopeptide repeat protein [Bryobacterales bacterium]|nr:tetratricopeptide repeat protein [Bryobacterales bacterium]